MCDGEAVWDNIIIVLPKKDFNPLAHEVEDWI